MLGLAFIKLFVLLSTLLILSKFLPSPGFYEGCVPVPYLWNLVHEHPCCRNSTFNHTLETHLFNTRSLVNANDDLLGNSTLLIVFLINNPLN